MITAVGSELTVTIELVVFVHPLELVTVTAYVPPVVTAIPAIVAELDHK